MAQLAGTNGGEVVSLIALTGPTKDTGIYPLIQSENARRTVTALARQQLQKQRERLERVVFSETDFDFEGSLLHFGL